MLPIVLAHLNRSTASNTPTSIWSMWNNIGSHHHQQQQCNTSGSSRSQSPPITNHHQTAIMTTGGSGVSSTTTTPIATHRSTTADHPTSVPKPTISVGGCFASTAIPKNSRSAAVSSRSVDFGRRTRPCRLDVSVDPRSQHLHFSDPSSPTTSPASFGHWIVHARLADDVHSHNAVVEVLRTANAAELRVRVLCDIAAGDELMLWFSEELLALLHIPFLTPANIRGKNTYTCNVCDRSFECPNPLKLHLATDCDRLTRDDLWRRMDNALAAENLSASAAAAAAAASPLLPFASTVQHLQSWLSGTMQQHHQHHHHHQQQQQMQQHPLLHPFFFGDRISGAAIPHLRTSAFQPPAAAGSSTRIAANCSPSSSTTTSPDLTAAAAMTMMLPATTAAFSMPTSLPAVPGMPPLMEQHPIVQHQHQQLQQHHHYHHPLMFGHSIHQSHHLQHLHHRGLDVACSTTAANSAAAAAAHLETIVSNMGTTAANSSKSNHHHHHHLQHQANSGGSAASAAVAGGHLCIYCGKVYSRKYGLKIHIRTHTGFKPLKCPYCARPFGDPSNLNKHVRLHVQGSTIYKCPVADCDKILVRRRDLQRHMQTQHALGDGGGDGDEEVDVAAMNDDGGRRRRCDGTDGVADDDDDGVVRTKRVRSESSSPAVSSGASSPSFMVDELSSDDD